MARPLRIEFAGQQYEYDFDHIGNRTGTRAGTRSGTSQRSASYSANRLNQYESRDVPGYVDLVGLAPPSQHVFLQEDVFGATPYVAYRQGEYFHLEFPTPNSSGIWNSRIKISSGSEQAFVPRVVPKNAEIFQHGSPENDSDDNLTQDGLWDYTWDAENRLVKMTSRPKKGSNHNKGRCSLDIVQPGLPTCVHASEVTCGVSWSYVPRYEPW